jgi:hypothetical protein
MIAVFLAYLLTVPSLFAICLLALIFEAFDNKMSVYTAILAMVVAYFTFNVPLQTLGICIVAYLVIGVIWSFWRFKRYIDKLVDAYNDDPSPTKYQRERLDSDIALNRNKSRIVSWIIVCPFSVVENIAGDVVRLLSNFVSGSLRYVYESIIKSATKNIKTVV